jgi:hypothetical protein
MTVIFDLCAPAKHRAVDCKQYYVTIIIIYRKARSSATCNAESKKWDGRMEPAQGRVQSSGGLWYETSKHVSA